MRFTSEVAMEPSRLWKNARSKMNNLSPGRKMSLFCGESISLSETAVTAVSPPDACSSKANARCVLGVGV